jgi:hypothetical protein
MIVKDGSHILEMSFTLSEEQITALNVLDETKDPEVLHALGKYYQSLAEFHRIYHPSEEIDPEIQAEMAQSRGEGY